MFASDCDPPDGALAGILFGQRGSVLVAYAHEHPFSYLSSKTRFRPDQAAFFPSEIPPRRSSESPGDAGNEFADDAPYSAFERQPNFPAAVAATGSGRGGGA